MLVGNSYDTIEQLQYVALYQEAIRTAADQARLVRQARQARPPRVLRRRLGGLLIGAGQALEGQRTDPEPCR
jgi:hypothetical protein